MRLYDAAEVLQGKYDQLPESFKHLEGYHSGYLSAITELLVLALDEEVAKINEENKNSD